MDTNFFPFGPKNGKLDDIHVENEVFELMAFQKCQLWLSLLPDSDIWLLRLEFKPFIGIFA